MTAAIRSSSCAGYAITMGRSLNTFVAAAIERLATRQRPAPVRSTTVQAPLSQHKRLQKRLCAARSGDVDLARASALRAAAEETNVALM